MVPIFMWIAGGVAAALLGVVAAHLYAARATGGIPTIVGWIPYLGVAVTMGSEGLAFFHRLQAKHGSIFRLLLAGERRVFVVNPSDVQSIWVEKHTFAFGGIVDEIVEKTMRIPAHRSALINDAYTHSLWMKHLHGRALHASNAQLCTLLERTLLSQYSGAAVGEWQIVPAEAWSFHLLFTVGARIVFGPTLRAEDVSRDVQVMNQGFHLLLAGLPDVVVGKYRAAGRRIAAELERHARDDRDAVAPLVRERIEYFISKGLTPGEIAGINTLLVWALQANTAPVAFWLLIRVVHDGDAYTALRQEVDDACAASGAWWRDAEGLGKRLDALHRLTSATQEAMRMCNNAASMRVAAEDTSITSADGRTYSIAEGERLILLSAHHFDERVFASPHVFKYDRFMPLPDGSARGFTLPDGRVLKNSMAFGGGASLCPGRLLAMNEVRLFMVLMLRYFDMQPVEGTVPPPVDVARTGIGMVPALHDVPMRLRWRGVAVAS